MKKLALSLAVAGVFSSLAMPAHAAVDDKDIGFKAAFYRPLYKTNSFGLLVTGSTVVAAGAFSYLTAGAGAPVAAAGVSTVASWIAGGGAGSYMAGASIVGGWFGGNAMLGAAVLNGLSLGTVGAASSWGALSAGQKALALGSTAATVMDGIAFVTHPKTGELGLRFLLAEPIDFADDGTRKLLDALKDAGEEVAKGAVQLASAKPEQAPGSVKSPKILELERNLEAAKAKYQTASSQLNAELDRVLASGASNRTTVLMAVIANNSGRSTDFRKLLNRIKFETLKDKSYLDFLRAIADLQVGKPAEAERRLIESRNSARYAIEPAIVLAAIAGGRNFKANEAKIDEITAFAEKNFDENKYVTRTSLVSLYYRIGTLALAAKRCDRALTAFKKAQDKHTLIEKYWTGKDIRNFLDIGEANALHCHGKFNDAYAIFNTVWQRTPGKEVRDALCEQFNGGCSKQ